MPNLTISLSDRRPAGGALMSLLCGSLIGSCVCLDHAGPEASGQSVTFSQRRSVCGKGNGG